MRVLFIDSSLPELLRDANYPAGGWAVQLRELLLGLRQTGHHAGVLVPSGTKSLAGPQDICELLETYDPARGIRKLRLFNYFVPAMLKAARAFHPDIVFQSCAGLDTGLMAFVARRLRVPFVHRVASDADTDDRCAERLSRRDFWIYNQGLKSAQLLICQNNYQYGQLRNRYPRKRILQLSNGIDVPALPAGLKSRHDRSYVAWIGTFREPKNLPLLCRLAAELGGIPFRVAGMLPAQPDRESVEAVAALRTLKNVELVGHVKRSEIFDFLSNAVLLVNTSRFEGFSNTFLEAFCTGTPIVAPANVDPNDIIARHALGHSAHGESDLSSSVLKMWNQGDDPFDEFSTRCRQYVEENLSRELIVKKLVSELGATIASFHANKPR